MGRTLLRLRIEDVSKNHQNQPFRLRVVPDTEDMPLNNDVAPDVSSPVVVRSKRNKRPSARRAPSFLQSSSQLGPQAVPAPAPLSQQQHLHAVPSAAAAGADSAAAAAGAGAGSFPDLPLSAGPVGGLDDPGPVGGVPLSMRTVALLPMTTQVQAASLASA